MARPVVAVVGRPNVGKSTLFNKLIGQRLSIVKDTPGVTRDRVFAPCEWRGRTLLLADTGGIEPQTDDILLRQMRRQAELAMEQADVIILVTDLHAGVTANDADVASMLQKSGKPVVLCVNKCDRIGELPPEFYEFYNLGLGDPVAVSSVHGTGTGDLLDAVFEYLPPEEAEEEIRDMVKVAVIGKPNAGKSSLVNAVAGEERSIVSDHPGCDRHGGRKQIRPFPLHRYRGTAPPQPCGRRYREIQHSACSDGRGAGGRLRDPDRRGGGLHRAGQQGGGSRARGGQSLRHRRQ